MDSKSTKGAAPAAEAAAPTPAATPLMFSVRAIPAPGHNHRRRAGRAWGKDPSIVRVVDEPAPPRLEKDRDGKQIVIHSDEISPAQLVMLQADPHLAVVPHGKGGSVGLADSLEIADLKSQLVKLQAALEGARKELADHVELLKIERDTSRRGAEEAGGQIVRLEGELAAMRAQLAKRQGRE